MGITIEFRTSDIISRAKQVWRTPHFEAEFGQKSLVLLIHRATFAVVLLAGDASWLPRPESYHVALREIIRRHVQRQRQPDLWLRHGCRPLPLLHLSDC